jgi:hypothetical protein
MSLRIFHTKLPNKLFRTLCFSNCGIHHVLRPSSKLFSTTNKPSDFPIIDFYSDSNSECPVGDYSIIASQSLATRAFTPVSDLKIQSHAWIRGRVSSIRVKGNACFVVIRSDTFDTIQACYFADKKADKEQVKKMVKFISDLTLESIVDIQGLVVPANVKSCSCSDIEIQIQRVYAVSRAPVVLPFSQDDASRGQAEIDASLGSERPFPNVPQV